VELLVLELFPPPNRLVELLVWELDPPKSPPELVEELKIPDPIPSMFSLL